MRVAVVGAGLAGLCSAFSLQRAGCHVIVIDRNPGPALETSFANGGLLTPSMAQPWNSPGVHRTLLRSIGRSDAPVMLRPHSLLSMGSWAWWFLRESRPLNYARNALRNCRLARYSLEVIDRQYQAPAAAATLRQSGVINLYRSDAELADGDRESRLLASQGLRHTVLSPRECVRQEPQLAAIEGELVGGIYFPEDRSGDAHLFCRAVASAIAAGGGELCFGAPVLDFVRSNGIAQAARTTAGLVEADSFVIAAGSHSRILAAGLGLSVPVIPAKGYSLSFGSQELPAMPAMPIVDASLHAAIATLSGVLRIAGTAEFAGFDRSVPPARVRNLRALFAKVYPRLAEHAASAQGVSWAGLRPMSSDGVPIIGCSKIKNVYLNTGHGHLGWTLAAGSGELLAHQVTGRQPALNPADYAPRAH